MQHKNYNLVQTGRSRKLLQTLGKQYYLEFRVLTENCYFFCLPLAIGKWNGNKGQTVAGSPTNSPIRPSENARSHRSKSHHVPLPK